MRLIFYDFEVFQNIDWWCVVLIDYETRMRKIIINDAEELKRIYLKHKDDIFIGYNSRYYDQYIFKAILLGMNPSVVNKYMIEYGIPGYQVVSRGNQLPLNNFDISTGFHSLKQPEGFLGDDIRESSVPFDTSEPMEWNEEDEVISYCIHDVEETIRVFEARKFEFDSQLGLIEAFNLDFTHFNKTKAQLSAFILGAERQEHNDEFDITIVDCLNLSTYKDIQEWFENPDNLDYSNKLKVNIYGVPHILGFGGIHGAIAKYKDDGFFVMSDIASMYPATMINFGFLSRNVVNPERYRQIRDDRIVLKHNGDPRQGAYKIVLNGTYGASKDKYNPLYDPLMANNVCINGQLLIVMLLEMLEQRLGNRCELIQSNTDGILVKLSSPADYDEYLAICKEWEVATMYELEHDIYKTVIQKDVNNYIIIDEKGKTKSKGAYVKKLTPIDYDLPILNQALMNFFTKNIPVEETINNCTCLKDFQKIVKVSNKYLYATHGEMRLKERVLRVFASKDENAKGVFKCKTEPKLEKIGNTPERCFILNHDINDMEIPDELDREWYIEMAKKRVKDFIN